MAIRELKAEVYLRAVFDANVSFTFQAVKNPSTHPTYLCSGLFYNFFGDFLVYLEIDSFSQRI